MRKILVTIIVISMLILLSNSVFAQDKAYRVFGLGVNIMDYGTVYIPINVASAFRLEPFVGFDFTSYEEFSNENEGSESDMQFGIGILPMIRRGSAVIYIGGRVGIAFYSDEYKNSDGDAIWEYSDFSFGIGPVIGGEYYFNPHISLGGEMSIMFQTFTNERNYTSEFQVDLEGGEVGIGTESAIFIRFYF